MNNVYITTGFIGDFIQIDWSSFSEKPSGCAADRGPKPEGGKKKKKKKKKAYLVAYYLGSAYIDSKIYLE